MRLIILGAGGYRRTVADVAARSSAIVKAENHIPRCLKIGAGEIIPNRTYPV